jgi:NAD/NADP transhydrogenase alpha subunit
MIPRTTRAQSMDALSSQASVAGYKAVLIAAAALPKYFPMLTTAAGTIAPAKVFVMGLGWQDCKRSQLLDDWVLWWKRLISAPL